jgi:ankyrin repeat protein
MALVTPLYAAAAGGRAGAVAALLEAGATVRGEAATAALVWACSHGHVEVVTLLAAAGASVNGRDKNRFVCQWKNGNGIVNTASSTSFFGGNAARLGGYGLNNGFETPLHAAVHAMHDTVDTVVALLDAGAALDADAAKPIKLPLLKALLKKKGLRTGGTKPALVERLREALL